MRVTSWWVLVPVGLGEGWGEGDQLCMKVKSWWVLVPVGWGRGWVRGDQLCMS